MKTNYYPYTFIRGKIVKTEDATVPVMTKALQYGIAVFGGMRGYYNKEKGYLSVFRMDDHYKRFLGSLNILDTKLPYDKEQLKKITLDLIKKNKPQTDTYFRPFAYADSVTLSPSLDPDVPFDFALYMTPLGEYLSLDKGLSVMVSSWRRISDNAIPSRGKISGGYINSALARKEAMRYGHDEAILLTENGHVSEGTGENIFIVRDGVLITPTESDDTLEGITRRSIIKLAQDLEIPVEKRSVDRSELYVADEIFFSGTAVQVAWVAKIDGRTIGTGKRGPITQKLQELFFRVVRGNEPAYESWCTKIIV